VILTTDEVIAQHPACVWKVDALNLTKEVLTMGSKRMLMIASITGVFAVVGGWAMSAQDKYTLKVPNGLAFSEFRGYEAWQVVSISQDGDLLISQ
jgi:hypothetical protein